MIFETDLWTIVSLVAGGILIGLLIAVLYLALGKKRNSSKLKKISAERGTLYLIFSRLCHRLSTSSLILKGYLSNLDSDTIDPKRLDSLRNTLSEESQAIDDLVTKLRVIVRLGVEGQPVVTEPVNMPRLVEEVMIAFGPSAESKGIILGGIVRKGRSDECYVSGDSAAIKEVISILLDNAVKHNESGTEITIETDTDNGFVNVTVADNGKGVEKDIQKQIFVKGNFSYHPRTLSGNGMGLFLCNLIVDLHGGRMELVNSAGAKGSSFKISLPCTRFNSSNS
jgi:signal transduction histidine kinase